MDQNRVDKLFREKVEEYQAIPSDDAWKTVNDHLHPRNKDWKLYLKVAAVTVVMLSVVMVLFQNREIATNPTAIVAVDFPQQFEETEIIIPEKDVTLAVIKNKTIVHHTTIPSELIIKQEPIEIQQIAVMDVYRKDFKSFEFPKPLVPIIQLMDPDEFKIKIKYYANATPEEDEASKGKIGKLFEYAQKTSPAEMLAKVRKAKDDFFSSRFNLN